MLKPYLYNIITRGPKDPLGFIIKALLFLLSLLYRAAICLRAFLYSTGIFRPERLKAPVISIGNITWGGTGKTPLARLIASRLVAGGLKVALLTRGYGSDEDKAFKEDVPGVCVLSGADRLKSARSVGRRPFDIFILDDGFQHYRIRRQLDIVTISALEPFGSGLLIPCGTLREPASALSRAEIAVLTKSDLISRERLTQVRGDILRINPAIEIFESIHRPTSLISQAGVVHEAGYIRGRKIYALSGLADNTSFLMSLERIGADVVFKSSYMDHYRYSRAEIEQVVDICKEKNIETVVTTKKDWVKLMPLLSSSEKVEFLILNIELKIDNEEDFFGRLHTIISG